MQNTNISDYIILQGGNIPGLQLAIEKALQSGWCPYGDLKILKGHYPSFNFFQAMVKYSAQPS